MAAAVIPATAWGEVEMLAARSGKAAMTIPSPRLERVDAAQRREKDRIGSVSGDVAGLACRSLRFYPASQVRILEGAVPRWRRTVLDMWAWS